jgi:hypothetical protein
MNGGCQDPAGNPIKLLPPTLTATGPFTGEGRPILDVPLRWGWPEGSRTEFAYVDFRGERWEERNIKTVYNRTFKWLWANRREDVLRWNNEIEHDGPIAGPGRIGRWDRLHDEHYVQMGLFYRYLLGIVQERYLKRWLWPMRSTSCTPTPMNREPEDVHP